MATVNRSRSRRPWFLLGGLLVSVFGAVAAYYFWPDGRKSDADELAATEANARGVAWMEQFEYAKAAPEFETASRLAPNWLPARINLGMALYNSAGKAEDPVLPRAIAVFQQVLKEDPANPYANFNLGIIYKYLAQFELARKHFRAVIDHDAEDDRAWLYLAYAHQDIQTNPECRRYLLTALKLNPYLVSATYGVANHADTGVEEQKRLLERMRQLQVANWEDEARPDKHSEQGRYATVIGTGLSKPPETGPPALFEQSPGYAVAPGTQWDTGARDGATVFDGLLRQSRARYGATILRFDFDGDGQPDLLLLASAFRNGKLCDVLLRNTGRGFEDISNAVGLGETPSLAGAISDFDNDGRPDVALATEKGLRLLRNVDGKRLQESTTAAGFNKQAGGITTLAWLDIDQDGDLDLLVGRNPGTVSILQNIGVAPPSRADEPTPPMSTAFRPIEFPDIKLPGTGVLGIVATDIDGDKDVDLIVLLNGAAPAVILNDRLMKFHLGGTLPGTSAGLRSGVILDANGDEQSDLFLLGAEKPAFLASIKENPDADFNKRFVAGATSSPPLLAAQRCDLDLDGRSDLVGLSIDGRAVFLQGDGQGKLVNHAEPFGPTVEKLIGLHAVAALDFTGDGVPDLLVWTNDGPKIFPGMSNGNHSLKLSFTGVRDNNNAGIGQKNLRTNTSGLGVKCRTLTGPLQSMVEVTTLESGPGQSLVPIEIGLGRRTEVDAVRLRWPDCVVQAETALTTGKIHTIRELNRKPTSCPVLMTWDGEKWVYITDFLGGGALGESGGDGSTRSPRPEESVKIESSQLGLKSGKYVVRIAEPMDEVMYLDRLRLAIVDHSADAVVFPDERFADPPPTQAILQFAKRFTPTSAKDHRGTDVAATLRERDGKTVGDFANRSWLGFAEEHFIEFKFGAVVWKQDAAKYLVLAGWTDYPYPESILAAEQAGVPMLAPVLEKRKTDGTWEKISDIGFPAGLPKVMTAPLPKAFDPSAKYRIRTNLQIYWDQLFLAAAEEPAAVVELPVSRAVLSHPGFVREILTEGKPPQAYDPNRTEVVSTTNWKGRLTRLGDVTPLIKEWDDRFVICGPGDEVTAEFDPASLPQLKAGWVRSFIIRTNGYCKDTAPTTQTGGNVDPIPFRAMKSYPHRESEPSNATEDRRQWHTRPAGTVKE